MSFRERQLGRAGLKSITRAVRSARGWTLTTMPIGGAAMTVAVSPDELTRIPFDTRSGYGTVVAQFRQAGLDVDPRRQRRDVRGRAVPGHMPFAALADILDDIEQMPLIDVPASVQRSWTFTDHAVERCADRNIGVFEVWAAIHAPQYTIDDPTRKNVRHFIRGDVEVVCRMDNRSILTVIDLLQHRRTTPRVALAPEVQRADSAHIAEEATMPKPKFDPTAYVSKAAGIRAVILNRRDGETFTQADIRADLPPSWHSNVPVNTHTLVRIGALAHHEGDGTYEIVDRQAIESIEGRADRNPGARKSRGTVRQELARYVRALAVGQEFTVADVRKALGHWTDSAIRTEIRKVMYGGSVHLLRTENGFHVYAKGRAPKRSAEPVTPVAAALALTGAVAPVTDDDTDDVDVSMGFAFEQLPASDVYDLVDQIRAHRRELEANPGQWARIATYHGPKILDRVSQRAGKLESVVSDPQLRFMVRRIGELDAALFVSWVAQA
jgi:hypothetical protein